MEDLWRITRCFVNKIFKKVKMFPQVKNLKHIQAIHNVLADVVGKSKGEHMGLVWILLLI